MRAMTRLTTETLLILGFAGLLCWFVNPWLGLFVGLVAVTALFPAFDRFAHWRRSAVLFGAAWYAVIYLWAQPEPLINAVCVVAMVNVAAVLMQAAGMDPYQVLSLGTMDAEENGRLIGLMFNENEASALFGLSFPAFCRRKWWKYIPALLLGLILTKSTVGIAAVVAALCVALAYCQMLWMALPVIVAGAAYVLFWDSNMVDSAAFRLDYAKLAARIVSDHPWGIGPGHWHLATNQLHAHNDIAQLTVESGVLGFGLMAGYAISLFRRVGMFGAMVLSSVLVVSACSFAWFIPTTALIMATLLAVADKENLQMLAPEQAGPENPPFAGGGPAEPAPPLPRG
jgi:hypothetical protein